MLSISLKTFNIKRPSGIIAGLTAAWAIFGLFLAVDSQLNVPPGTFYKMVGIVFGVNSAYAMYVGFLLFMITAVIISMIYNYVSERVRIFRISSMPNGLNPGNLDSSVADQLIQLSDAIILGSLALHMLFGGVMGFCSRLAAI
jgi:hypothetical protein